MARRFSIKNSIGMATPLVLSPTFAHASPNAPDFFGDANYTGATGWPDMIQTLTENCWMGIAPRRQADHHPQPRRLAHRGRADLRELGAGGSARRLPAARCGRVRAAARVQQGPMPGSVPSPRQRLDCDQPFVRAYHRAEGGGIYGVFSLFNFLLNHATSIAFPGPSQKLRRCE